MQPNTFSGKKSEDVLVYRLGARLARLCLQARGYIDLQARKDHRLVG